MQNGTYAPRNSSLSRRRILSNIFVALLLVLSVQFVAKVYAMTFTLSYSSSESKQTRSVVVADLDGDGDLDYIAGNYDTGAPVVDNDVYRNDGGMTFTRMGTVGSSTSLVKFVARDIDNDGDIDICLVNESVVSVYKNLGSYSFSAGYTYNYASGESFLEIIDMDNDGDLDIISSSTQGVDQAVHINDGHGNFTPANSTLPIVGGMISADFNSDSYADLMLFNGARITAMRGSGTGAFVSMFTVDPGGNTIYAMAAGDIDGDGDIDIVTVTSDTSERLVPWFNNGLGTSFTSGTTTDIVATPNAISLADLDNDGDLDALVGAFGGSQAYLNDGSGVFTPSGSVLGVGDVTKDVEVGDFDGDGDLDYVAGNDGNGSGKENRIYANDQALTSPNTAPTAPSSLTVSKVSDNGSTATLRLSWGSGSDTETATRMLQYQPKVGTGSDTNNIVSGITASPNWVNRLMPNGQSRTYLLKNVPCNNKTYYWNVATVDTGFKSTWGTEKTFDLSGSCVLSTGTSTPSTGGGISAKFFDRSGGLIEEEPPPPDGTITLSSFADLSGNGIHDGREELGFTGLPITASGRTFDQKIIRTTQTIDATGHTTFRLPPSDGSGYTISVDTGSLVLQGYTFTTPHSFTGILLLSSATKTISVGFRRNTLLNYHPCLRIGAPPENERKGTDPEILLQRLRDPYDVPVLQGIDLPTQGSVITRHTFFTLLRRTQCVPLTRGKDLQARLRDGAKALSTYLPLFDLLLTPETDDSLTLYSLIAHAIDVTRDTLKGPAADLRSPITRAEVIRALASVLPPSTGTGSMDLVPPKDIPPHSPLLPDVLLLQSLGILPQSFLQNIAPNQGIDITELATLLTRTAFRTGKISLLPEINASTQPPETTTNFLTTLPPLQERSCLQENADRASQVTFTDLLPDHPLYHRVRSLLTRYIENADDKPLWLLTATSRPTEFGIKHGSSTMSLTEPVSILEILRSLLILACLPPDTAKIIVAGNKERIQGTAESIIPRDRIADLSRDASFTSRIFYGTQDHQKEFDLSLFTYAPELLRKAPRSPASPLTADEAGSLLSSALLMIAVRDHVITPQEAENLAVDLKAAILTDLLGRTIDWRDEAATKNLPFTRSMLLQFLSTVIQNRTDTSSTAVPPLPLGEVWWERVG